MTLLDTWILATIVVLGYVLLIKKRLTAERHNNYNYD